MSEQVCDVAIIGGGPSGATVGCLLKQYNPDLHVMIFEREAFPRDHVGESLLPPTSSVLLEMGCWDEVEAANFPIKIGATLRWGKNPELWNFEFFPADQFVEEARPAKFEGQRRLTSFQVDRAIFDDILLRRAATVGCDVRQQTRVHRVHAENGRIAGLEVEGIGPVEARYYVDASGGSGILRKALDVPCRYPSTLQNIAIWDYWQNAEWAVEIGRGATRIQVRSIGFGWLWFIPLGETRTSVGLVIPVAAYKEFQKRPEELYLEALGMESEISSLLERATREGRLQSTRDWSFVAEKQCGDNWFLVGESGGFADPILSAGVSMAMLGARQAAYTILEMDRREVGAKWLLEQFEARQKRRTETHISFADYWYSTNAQFKDLKEFTAELAKANGLDLDPENAWRWLAQGGFIDEDLTVGVGGFNLLSIRSSGEFLTELKTDSPLEENNLLTLDLKGAMRQDRAAYADGRVHRSPCYVRNGKILPLRGAFGVLVQLLQREPRLPAIVDMMTQMAKAQKDDPNAMAFLSFIPEALEGMIRDGWLKASYDPRLPSVTLRTDGTGFHRNRDNHRPK